MSGRGRAGDPSPRVTPLVQDRAGPLAFARSLADLSTDAMFLASPSGALAHANSAARALFGLGDGALDAHNLRVLVPGCPSDLRIDTGRHDWVTEVHMPGGGAAEVHVRLQVLDPPRRSVLALVARRLHPPPPVAEGSEEQRWALAAQGSTDGFWHRPDAELDDAWWSPRLYEMLGYQPGDLQPCLSALIERMHPDDRVRFLAQREQDLLSGAPIDDEVRLRHRSGEYRHFRIRGVVTRERAGRPVSLSGSMQDVTELRRTHDALETSQARMRTFADAASDYFFEMNENLVVTWVSEGFERITGVQAEELLGHCNAHEPPPGMPEDDWRALRDVLVQHRPFRDFELRRVRDDGTELVVSISGRPILDDGGAFRGYRGVGCDVTQRVHMEDSLRESEEKYRTIVEADHDAVLVVDAADRVVRDANSTAARLYGLEPGDLLRTRIDELTADIGATLEFLATVCARGAGSLQREIHRSRDGREFPVEISGRRVTMSGRDAIVCMVRDVSQREQALAALRESEARFKAVVDNAPFHIYLKDRGGRYSLANPATVRAWGRPLEEILGHTAEELFPEEHAEETRRQDAEVLERNEPLAVELRHVGPDGETRELRRVKFPVPDAGGEATSVGVIAHDVTETRHAIAALAKSEARFRDFAELAADYLFEADADLRFTYVSERCRELCGYSPEELIGRVGNEIFDSRCDNPEMLTQHLLNVANHKPSEIEYTRTHANGGSYRVFVRITPMHDDAGNFIGYRGITRDMTESHEMAERLAYQATHDPLTGLVNRSEFERRLGGLLQSAREDNSAHALCYVDLDQFKVVNDTCGHVAGDALLERLAETVTFRVRQRDTVARLGGDEFGVLIEHCSLEQASRVATALHRAISEFVFTWEGKHFQVGASVGLVAITPELGDVADVLAAADSACYVAKDQGRNRIQVYAEDDAVLRRRRGEMNWVSHISGALAENRFRLRAQPVVPLSPRLAGAHHCELLLVMLDEDGKEVMPGAFLPAAERYNLATRIDRWVVGEALAWLADESDDRGRPALCGINLSAHSLVEDGFVDYIRRECERRRIAMSRLCFEITETAAISNLDLARRFMAELKADGARFALDDFGKGLSSFGYLRALPVDYIKIDAQFVRDLLDDPIDLAMVKSIDQVARLMKKRTIAEGVERPEVLTKLREVGVDYAQGYAVGAPRYLHD